MKDQWVQEGYKVLESSNDAYLLYKSEGSSEGQKVLPHNSLSGLLFRMNDM